MKPIRERARRSLSQALYGEHMSSEPPAGRSPTLESVARAAGVSRATVSRVVNGIRNVDPAIQEAVQRAVVAVGYVPNRAARSLVTRRTGLVAMVLSEARHHAFDGPFLSTVFTDPFFGRALGGLLGVLRPLGAHLLLRLVDTDDARTQLLADLRHGQLDGVALISLNAEDPLPGLLAEARQPVVLFGRPAQPLALSYVDIPQREAAGLAADHLVERGRRHVACISGPPNTPAGQDRLAGFRTAMARHGRAYVPSVESDFTHDGGERAMIRLLDEHPDTDGVFAGNDLMAQGATLALRERGRRVPDDVAVVGFDDSSAALACRPQLTTVRQPLEEMAAEMARLLLDRIDRPDRDVASVIFDPTLVIRRST